MELYDFLMIAVLVGATLFGAWKGLVWQIASLGAIIASYLVALRFRDQMSGYVHAEPPWNVFVAMLVLYIGTSLAIWIVFRMVSKFIDRMRLKEFDRQIGAIFGFAKGVLLCVIITLFAVTLAGEAQRQAIVRSRSGMYIARLLDKSSAIMPREVHEILDPYINSLDRELSPGAESLSETVDVQLQAADEALQRWGRTTEFGRAAVHANSASPVPADELPRRLPELAPRSAAAHWNEQR